MRRTAIPDRASSASGHQSHLLPASQRVCSRVLPAIRLAVSKLWMGRGSPAFISLCQDPESSHSGRIGAEQSKHPLTLQGSDAVPGEFRLISRCGDQPEVDGVFGGVPDAHGHPLCFVQRENIGVIVRIVFDRLPGEDLVPARRNASKTEPAF